MDFIVVYSEFSNACRQLFELYPNLKDNKGLCADSEYIRSILFSQLKVSAVPTLLVVDSSNVLQRVIGIDAIRNWLWIIFNEVESLKGLSAAESVEEERPEAAADNSGIQELSQNAPLQIEAGQTSLFEDDLLPSSPPPAPMEEVKRATNGTVKNLADELQREREMFLKKSPT
jgi:hypothetical protein